MPQSIVIIKGAKTAILPLKVSIFLMLFKISHSLYDKQLTVVNAAVCIARCHGKSGIYLKKVFQMVV